MNNRPIKAPILLLVIFAFTKLYAQDCTNIGFENGTTAGWKITADTNTNSSIVSDLTTVAKPSLYKIIPTGSIVEKGILNSVNAYTPTTGNAVLRIGNTSNSSDIVQATRTLQITEENCLLTIEYLFIVGAAEHTCTEQPYFDISVFSNSNGKATLIPCGNFYNAAPAWSCTLYNEEEFKKENDAYYKPWKTVAFDLRSYIGQSIKLRLTAAGCTRTGHLGIAYFDVRCSSPYPFSSSLTEPADYVQPCTLLSESTKVNIEAFGGMASYEWMGSNGFTLNSQTLITEISDTTLFDVKITPYSFTSQTCPTTFKVRLLPRKSPSAAFDYEALCKGEVQFKNSSIVGADLQARYEWDFNNDGIIDNQELNPNYLFEKADQYKVKLKVTKQNGCADSVVQLVNAKKAINPTATDTSVCMLSPAFLLMAKGDMLQWYDNSYNKVLGTPLIETKTAGEQTYYVAAHTDGCYSDTLPVKVKTKGLPIVSITDPDPVCKGNTIDITDASLKNSDNKNIVYNYYTNADTLTKVAIKYAQAVDTSVTFFIQPYDSITGCYNSALPIVVNIKPLPNFSVNNPSPVCMGNTVDITEPALKNSDNMDIAYNYYTSADTSTKLLVSYAKAVDSSAIFYIQPYDTITGCYNSALPIMVNIKPLPIFSVNNPSPVCMGNTVDITQAKLKISDNNAIIYNYYTNADTSTKLLVSYAKAIDSSATFFIQPYDSITGCYNNALPIKITVTPLPTFSVKNPEPVCAGNMVDITDASLKNSDNNAIVYNYYTNADTTTKLPISYARVVDSSATFYIQPYDSITGCYNNALPIKTTVKPLPTFSVANPNPVCAGNTVNITQATLKISDNNAIVYNYYTNADTATMLPISYASVVDSSATFYIQPYDTITRCYNSALPIVVTVKPLPTFSVNNPEPVCAGNTVDITGVSLKNSDNSAIVYNYYTTADTTTKVLASYAKAVDSSATFYIQPYDTVTSCYNSALPIAVNINPLPTFSVNNPNPVCMGNTIDITEPTLKNSDNKDIVYNYYTTADTITSVNISYAKAIDSSATFYIQPYDTITGCHNSALPIVVNIKPLPTFSINNPNPVCAGNTVDITDPALKISDNNAIIYNYYATADTTTLLPISFAKVVDTSATFYIQPYDTITRCYNSALPIVVSVRPLPTFSVNSPNAVCMGNTIDITDPTLKNSDNKDIVYNYYMNADTSTSVNLNYTRAVDSSGTFYIQPYDTATRCYNSALPIVVNINPLPTFSVNNPEPVCRGNTVDITEATLKNSDNKNLIYNYYANIDMTVKLDIKDAQKIDSSATFYIQPYDTISGCYNNALPMIVVVRKTPELALKNAAVTCAGNTINLANHIEVSAGTVSSTSFYSDSTLSKKISNSKKIDSSGTYYVQGIDAFSCSTNILPIPVKFVALPQLKLMNIQYPECFGSTLTGSFTIAVANSDRDISSYRYILNNQVVQGNGSFSKLKPGTYNVKVEDGLNCSSEMSVALNTKGDCDLIMPNAFSANKDGINDVFRPARYGNISAYKINIYNRWGNMVYTGNDPSTGWDGNGHTAGTYVWIVQYKNSLGESKTLKGWVVMLK